MNRSTFRRRLEKRSSTEKQTFNFARTHSLLVAVGSGGHNVSGSGACDGGLMLDMSRLKSVRVDPARRTARAEPDLTWGEFDPRDAGVWTGYDWRYLLGNRHRWRHAERGLRLAHGKHGLALDNLVSVGVVSADGQLRTASATENADLFSGLRGAHSNLGVVTSLEYRLHPVGPIVLAGMVLHPLETGREDLRFYRDYTSQAPEEMGPLSRAA